MPSFVERTCAAGSSLPEVTGSIVTVELTPAPAHTMTRAPTEPAALPVRFAQFYSRPTFSWRILSHPIRGSHQNPSVELNGADHVQSFLFGVGAGRMRLDH